MANRESASSPALSASERQQRYRANHRLISIDVAQETREAIAALRTLTGLTTDKTLSAAVQLLRSTYDEPAVADRTSSPHVIKQPPDRSLGSTPTTDLAPDSPSPGGAPHSTSEPSQKAEPTNRPTQVKSGTTRFRDLAHLRLAVRRISTGGSSSLGDSQNPTQRAVARSVVCCRTHDSLPSRAPDIT
jgi:hypothetical protein